MTIVRPARVRVAQALALAAAIAALALCLRASPAWFFGFALAAVATLALPWLEWSSPPLAWQRALPRVHGLVLLTVALVAWFSRSLAVMDVPAATLASLGGAVVVPIALVFAVAPRRFPPGLTLVPSILYLLGLAGLDPAPPGYGRSPLPFLQGADHTAFAAVYLGIAVLVLAALWTSTLAASGPRWRWRAAAGQAVAAALAVALAATGVVGLPTLQPHIERALANALDQGQTGLSGESTLGEFASLAVSRTRVLDLQAESLGVSPSAACAWLLRSEVFTVFDGRRWTPPAASPRDSDRVLLPTAAVDAGPLLEDMGAWFRPSPTTTTGAVALRINQHELGRWPLLLPRSASAVTADAYSLQVDRYGSIRRAGGSPLPLYGAVLPAARGQSSTASPGAGPLLTPGERAENLTLPPSVDPRVRALAARLAPATSPPRSRLAATVAHLHGGYTYTLSPGAFRTRDPLAEFLFEKKAAYCEYFASAAVVLLRLEGVPARFVKGLSVGPQTDRGGGLHVVRESDAHAWVEAWLPGEGWVEADPTPPGQFATAHAPPGAFERIIQRAHAALALAWSRVVNRGPMAFLRGLGRDLAALASPVARAPLAWLALVAVLFGPRLHGLWRARRGRRRTAEILEARAVPAELRALVHDVERRWRTLGRPRPVGRGLLEHARALCADAGSGATIPAPLAAECREIVELYYRARFGCETPSAAEWRRLRVRLRATVATALLAAAIAIAGLAGAVSAAPPSGVSYLVSESESSVRVHVGKSGLLSFAGHVHEVAAPVTGSISADPANLSASSVELSFPTARFQVLPGREPAGDAPKVEEVMRGPRVLDAGRFAQVRFRSRRVTGRAVGDAGGGVSWEVRVTGDLTIHGVTREVVVPMSVTLEERTLRATGRSTIGHDQFGLTPVSAGGGAVRVRNEIAIDFAIVAHRQP